MVNLLSLGGEPAGHPGTGPQVCVCGAGDSHLWLPEGHTQPAQCVLHLRPGQHLLSDLPVHCLQGLHGQTRQWHPHLWSLSAAVSGQWKDDWVDLGNWLPCTWFLSLQGQEEVLSRKHIGSSSLFACWNSRSHRAGEIFEPLFGSHVLTFGNGTGWRRWWKRMYMHGPVEQTVGIKNNRRQKQKRKLLGKGN